mgnify:CR=1 FL=1
MGKLKVGKGIAVVFAAVCASAGAVGLGLREPVQVRVQPVAAEQPVVAASKANPEDAAMPKALSVDTVKSRALAAVNAIRPANLMIGSIKVQKASADKQKIAIDFSENTAYIPFNPEEAQQLKENIKKALGKEYSNATVELTIDGVEIDKFAPVYATKAARGDSERFITINNPSQRYSKGLDGNVIAMWQSHGWYFEPKLNRWEWQRARIFQTVEDVYTQSYVLPFLMPMLENAGAYVMSPRERDIHEFEVIVDNDGGLAQNGYAEKNNGKKWKKGKGEGFAYEREAYVDSENPFAEGTFRMVDATRDAKRHSVATWSANMPESGEYAVYVSYKTMPNSATDAKYVISTTAGEKTITVNQKMGGGTWIFLGYYPLKAGLNKNVVTLSNYSNCEKAVITADAVKIGGGMGNIGRRVKLTDEQIAAGEEQLNYEYVRSNHPRFTEASRYWLQWAGAPDSVYAESKHTADYTDDYRCRGYWVNWIAGGSSQVPTRTGLNIPVDLSFAFHTDAGTTMNDDIIGTLGIFNSKRNDGVLANGAPRWSSRTLTDLVMTNIVNDIRSQFEPNWSRRGMWDRAYSECTSPEVPSMLLELLSHQNFADMKYGLDPNFRFTVSRGIYKGILEFLARSENREYKVQPLAVNSFAISQVSEGKYLLSWKATRDSLCADGAMPSKYVVLERVGERSNGFKEIAVVEGEQYVATVQPGKIYSYQIVAMNDGGRSFPSETLAVGEPNNSKGTVVVVNGFTRVSAPDWFDAGKIAGFYDERDHGVPYIKDINFIGSQFEFRRDIPWMDDDCAGFGASRSMYETKVIAGNTFDYTALHGEAIMNAGYGFVSMSVQAVENGASLSKYKTMDLILGKQKEVMNGRGAYPNRYKALTPALRQALKNYTSQGGNVFASGAFIATDIWDPITRKPVEEEKEFAKKVLGYEWRVGQASQTGEAKVVQSKYSEFGAKDTAYNFSNELNAEMYCVESPDAVIPADKKGFTIMRYSENNIAAAVASEREGYRTVIAGFPFETIKSDVQRNTLMNSILNFFETK